MVNEKSFENVMRERTEGKKIRDENIYLTSSLNTFVLFFLEGDSGGPLMILNQTDHRWYLFGITSHGASTEAIKPGVYSSVSTKLDFIRKYL